jgi:hypothetical protein
MRSRPTSRALGPYAALSALCLALSLAAGVCTGLAQPAASPDATAKPAPTPASVDSVIDLILSRDPDIRSYAAHATLDIQQVDFPYLHPVLDGHVYYTAPGYTIYDFPHTPSYLQGITRVEGAMGMASRWRRCYNIALDQQPGVYILHMVPKIRGEVSQLDVTVNQRNGNLEHFTWSYHDSAEDSISLTQYYANVGGYDVVTLQRTDITRHHIRAKGTGTFDSFQYNVPVPTPTPTPSDPLHQCDN